MCLICEPVVFETGELDDRNKLMEKDKLCYIPKGGLYVNGNELLTVEYCIGYYIIRQRCEIDFCPKCGKELEKIDEKKS